MTDIETCTRLPDYHLRKVDHLSMASAAEARLPCCQPAVMEVAAALSEPVRVGRSRGKLEGFRCIAFDECFTGGMRADHAGGSDVHPDACALFSASQGW